MVQHFLLYYAKRDLYYYAKRNEEMLSKMPKYLKFKHFCVFLVLTFELSGVKVVQAQMFFSCKTRLVKRQLLTSVSIIKMIETDVRQPSFDIAKTQNYFIP